MTSQSSLKRRVSNQLDRDQEFLVYPLNADVLFEAAALVNWRRMWR